MNADLAFRCIFHRWGKSSHPTQVWLISLPPPQGQPGGGQGGPWVRKAKGYVWIAKVKNDYRVSFSWLILTGYIYDHKYVSPPSLLRSFMGIAKSRVSFIIRSRADMLQFRLAGCPLHPGSLRMTWRRRKMCCCYNRILYINATDVLLSCNKLSNIANLLTWR